MNKNIVYSVLLAAAMTAPSCKKVLDINDNPNASAKVTNDMLLAGSLLNTARMQSTTLNELGSFWAGYWGKAYDVSGTTSGAAGTTLDLIGSENIIDNFATDIWDKTYTNIYNYVLLEKQAQGTAPFYSGVAKIIRGMHYLQLVDHYNNIPFSQASNPENRQPAYDQGAEVYAGATDLISAGIDEIKSAAGTSVPTASDIFFKGDAASWIRFGNTLKLRALLQQSGLPEKSSYILQEMARIKAEGSGFLTADVMASPGFTTQADNQQNPFYTTYFKNSQGVVSAMFNAVRPTRYLLSKYEALSDPRMALIYAEAVSGGGYKGVVLGQNTADVTQNAAATSAFRGPSAGVIKTATSGALVFSLAESLFLQAEAAQRGWTDGSAGSLYEQAIRASFTYTGVPATAFDAYNAQSGVNFTAVPAGGRIERIIAQKWLALNSIDGAAAWNDFRRLGFPSDLPASAAQPAGVYPKRLRYPVSELSSNSGQVVREGNIDGLTSKVFWQP